MKTELIIMTLLLLLSASVFPQMDEMRQRDRIAQLEKLKLIEALELNEETAVRFFARRKELQKELESLERRSKELLEQLDKSLKSKKPDSEREQQKIINELLDLKVKIEQRKKDFVFSLSDILSTEQVSKYLLFERSFREEIRKILLDRRKSSR